MRGLDFLWAAVAVAMLVALVGFFYPLRRPSPWARAAAAVTRDLEALTAGFSMVSSATALTVAELERFAALWASPPTRRVLVVPPGTADALTRNPSGTTRTDPVMAGWLGARELGGIPMMESPVIPQGSAYLIDPEVGP